MDRFEKSEDTDFKIAYVIPSDWDGMTLEVHFTANAWWKDPTIVIRLLDAFDKHKANIEQACDYAGISIKQYKYFAKLHPLINERRKLIYTEMDFEKKMILGGPAIDKDPKAAAQWLAYTEPYEWDLRYKSPMARLRRQAGIPANPKPKTEGEKRIEMEEAVEKNRKYFNWHSSHQ